MSLLSLLVAAQMAFAEEAAEATAPAWGYLGLVAVGVVLLAVGFDAAFTRKAPLNWLGAAAAPVGLLLALVGVVLTCVPTFFTGS